MYEYVSGDGDIKYPTNKLLHLTKNNWEFILCNWKCLKMNEENRDKFKMSKKDYFNYQINLIGAKYKINWE